MRNEIELSIAGEYYREISSKIDDQDTVNFYNIVDPTAGASLTGTPGYLFAKTLQVGTDPVRGEFADDENNRAFVVTGTKVYLLDTSLNATEIGTLTTSTGPVYIVPNTSGSQVMFVDGQKGFIYDTAGGSFTQITAIGFPANPTRVAFLDAFFIVTGGGTDLFFISAPNDGMKWDALRSRAQAYAQPGNLIGCEVIGRRLYLFKTSSVEVWLNVGKSDFPLRRDNNLLFDFGCASVGSISNADLGILFWLAADSSGVGSVMMTTTKMSEPQIVSTPAIDKLIQSFSAPSDCRGFVFKNDDGTIFYQLSFTTDDVTLLYNHSAPKGYQWSRLKRIPQITAGYKSRHIADCHMYFNGHHYIGSFNEPKLYEMSLDFDDYNGEPINRQRVMQTFTIKGYKRFRMDKLIIDAQMGIGSVTGTYANPKIYLSISRDGGETFGNQLAASLGKLGQRKIRCIWRKLGIADSANGIIFKLDIYAAVSPIVLMGGTLTYEGFKT